MACKETQFAQALLNADAVARARGEKYGLCDCVDKRGNPYPSQWLSNLLNEAREQMGLTAEAKHPVLGKWMTLSQWESWEREMKAKKQDA